MGYLVFPSSSRYLPSLLSHVGFSILITAVTAARRFPCRLYQVLRLFVRTIRISEKKGGFPIFSSRFLFFFLCALAVPRTAWLDIVRFKCVSATLPGNGLIVWFFVASTA